MKASKIYLIIILTLFFNNIVRSQTTDNLNYIKRFKKVAMDEMRVYKIPASITLAQGILESSNGKSELSAKSNNHFGIKCTSDWKGKRTYHDDDKKDDCFRVYPSPWGSFRDHSKFLSRKRYSALFELKITDYKGWAYGLKKAGYATDSKYPQKLIRIIESNQLYKYDEMVLQGESYTIEEVFATAGPLVIKEHKNRLDYIVVRDGETYESIAMELDIKLKKIFEYNDKTWDSPLASGDILFIERKRTKGKGKYYKVKKGDSMHQISQKEGIKLEYLYKRNKMPFGSQPKVGTTLYLRRYKK